MGVGCTVVGSNSLVGFLIEGSKHFVLASLSIENRQSVFYAKEDLLSGIDTLDIGCDGWCNIKLDDFHAGHGEGLLGVRGANSMCIEDLLLFDIDEAK